MKPPTVHTAEHLARAAEGDGAILLVFDGDRLAGASWGATVPRCARLGRMLDAIVDRIEAGRSSGDAPAATSPPAARPAPKIQTDAPASEWEEFIGEALDLLARLNDLHERPADFADGVSERLMGMIEWAEQNERVTAAMQTALDNMESGVARWER